MKVTPTNPAEAAQRVAQTPEKREPAKAPENGKKQDSVEISQRARELSAQRAEAAAEQEASTREEVAESNAEKSREKNE